MSKDIALRRDVLRGGLALGCGVWLPMVMLSGCDARNSTTPTSVDPTATSAPGTETSPSAVPAKMAKAAAQYQPQPKGEQKCAVCLHFIAASNTCQLVEGPISPDGWCMLWVKKA